MSILVPIQATDPITPAKAVILAQMRIPFFITSTFKRPAVTVENQHQIAMGVAAGTGEAIEPQLSTTPLLRRTARTRYSTTEARFQ